MPYCIGNFCGGCLQLMLLIMTCTWVCVVMWLIRLPIRHVRVSCGGTIIIVYMTPVVCVVWGAVYCIIVFCPLYLIPCYYYTMP